MSRLAAFSFLKQILCDTRENDMILVIKSCSSKSHIMPRRSFLDKVKYFLFMSKPELISLPLLTRGTRSVLVLSVTQINMLEYTHTEAIRWWGCYPRFSFKT
ncbi:hypothetical protein AMECASPLE_026066 [Ameca splendens]|uniref:Uncharacterized protein n=1 Tax=Ameca splendens TaxID=208324 RepID=A0ABV0Y531_9TELE